MGKSKAKYTVVLGSIVLGGFLISQFRSNDLEPSDFELGSIDFQEPRDRLDVGEIKEDVRYLVEAFDQAYAGKIVRPDAYLKMKEELRQIEVKNPDGLSTVQFYRQMVAILTAMPDGHLAVVPLTLPDEPDHIKIAKIQTFNPTRRISSHIEESHSARGSYAGHFEEAGKNIFRIRIEEFDGEPRFEGATLVDSISKSLPKSDAVIFDLRGNNGGYIENVLRIAALLWGENYRDGSYIQYYPQPIQTSGTIDNGYAYALAKNMAMISGTRFGLFELKTARMTTLERIFNYNEFHYGSLEKKTWRSEYDYVRRTNVEENTYNYDFKEFRERAFQKPIYVLVDEGCLSACEMFLEALELHPHVTTIGRQTGGAVQFGAITNLVLPKSHLVLNVPTSYIKYKDERNVERIGYRPKIPVKVGDDAEMVARRHLRN